VVVTRKQRRENKEISIYLNNKPLEQVNIKYLGITLDSKLNFREYFMYITGNCNKLIHALAK
jgi:hypothetical protein